MKTFEQFLGEMITVGVSKHPSKPGYHIISVKHASSMPTQFPHEREVSTKELGDAVKNIRKYYGHGVTIVKYRH